MWKLFLQLAVLRTVLRSFGWLIALIPFGFLLKTVGWPLLVILGVLGLPVIVVLLLLGLPIFVVLVMGMVLMAIVGFVLSIGVPLLKIVLPIALVVWLVGWLLRDRSPGGTKPDEPLTGEVRGPDPSVT